MFPVCHPFTSRRCSKHPLPFGAYEPDVAEVMTASAPPLYTIPIHERPPGYGSLFSKVVFPLVFNLGIIGLNSVQFLCLLFKLIPGDTGKRLYRSSIDWTKDGFGRLRGCKGNTPNDVDNQ